MSPRIPSGAGYDEVYRDRAWAYGDKPDSELIKSLVDVPRGRALDLGAGQGRHALALSALGFDVIVVDNSAEGLHQAAAASAERGLSIHVHRADAAKYEPEGEFQVIVAALLFHLPSRRTALQTAKRMGASLASGGRFYLSLPGFTKETEGLARDLMAEAGCHQEWVTKKLVTKRDRPRLGVPRRNETRALGVAVIRR